jgi:hypothetical protein
MEEGVKERYVEYSEGILYRPRLSYGLYVFQKENRKLSGGWKLAAQHKVFLANLSPMVAVGVDRTLFSSRNTSISFTRGSLTNIAVAKRSELANAITIPLSVMQTVTALPSQVVQLRITETTQLGALADAHKQLLQAELMELQLLERLENEKLAKYDKSTNNPDTEDEDKQTASAQGDAQQNAPAANE